jgi:hypothetical protein
MESRRCECYTCESVCPKIPEPENSVEIEHTPPSTPKDSTPEDSTPEDSTPTGTSTLAGDDTPAEDSTTPDTTTNSTPLDYSFTKENLLMVEEDESELNL